MIDLDGNGHELEQIGFGYVSSNRLTPHVECFASVWLGSRVSQGFKTGRLSP